MSRLSSPKRSSVCAAGRWRTSHAARRPPASLCISSWVCSARRCTSSPSTASKPAAKAGRSGSRACNATRGNSATRTALPWARASSVCAEPATQADAASSQAGPCSRHSGAIAAPSLRPTDTVPSSSNTSERAAVRCVKTHSPAASVRCVTSASSACASSAVSAGVASSSCCQNRRPSARRAAAGAAVAKAGSVASSVIGSGGKACTTLAHRCRRWLAPYQTDPPAPAGERGWRYNTSSARKSLTLVKVGPVTTRSDSAAKKL